MNTPYVKHTNSIGEVINPIKDFYLHEYPNRKERRAQLKRQRFYGESKNLHLTVLRNAKYLRLKQLEFDKKGNKKVIEHYILQ